MFNYSACQRTILHHDLVCYWNKWIFYGSISRFSSCWYHKSPRCINTPLFNGSIIDLLIVWCLTQFSTLVQLLSGAQCTIHASFVVFFTSTPHKLLFKPLAVFCLNRRGKNGRRRERNKSCPSDYRHFLEKFLAEPGIESATSCSKDLYATDWATGVGAESARRERMMLYDRWTTACERTWLLLENEDKL